jgi:hypothetical protein
VFELEALDVLEEAIVLREKEVDVDVVEGKVERVQQLHRKEGLGEALQTVAGEIEVVQLFELRADGRRQFREGVVLQEEVRQH